MPAARSAGPSPASSEWTRCFNHTWPRWAPAGGWLAVSTKRNYGHTTSDLAQLWVTAIDFSLAAQGVDPSQPPAWIPGQLTTAGNHTPTWLPRFN